MTPAATLTNWQRSIKAIAAELGCPNTTAASWRRAHTGYSAKRGPRKTSLPALRLRTMDWDWSLSLQALATRHGLTRERIRQIRRELGLPASRCSTHPRRP